MTESHKSGCQTPSWEEAAQTSSSTAEWGFGRREAGVQ